MTTASYDFEGTAGTYPANASGSYTGWNVYALPTQTSADFQLSTTEFVDGSSSGKTTASSTQYAGYYNNTPASDAYHRIYVKMSAYPTVGVRLGMIIDSGFSTFFAVGISADGAVWGGRNPTDLTGDTGTNKYKSANYVVPLDEWVRFEFRLTQTGYHIKMWKTTGGGGYNSSGTADLDSTYTTGTSVGTLGQSNVSLVRFVSGSYGAISTSPIYMDGFGADTASWVGPLTLTSAGTSFAGIVPI